MWPFTKRRRAAFERAQAEPLEPRLLYSADLAAALGGVGDPQAGAPAAEMRSLDAAGDYAATASLPLAATASLPPAATANQASATTSPAPAGTTDMRTGLRELAFIDNGIADRALLVADLARQQAAGRAIDIIDIGRAQDGIAVITEALGRSQGIGAIHLLAHGSDGRVHLGNADLDAAALGTRAAEVAGWGAALAPGADLLIYGCDVAAGARGMALIDRLAALTGADVAASDDITGAAALGGDWRLEQRTGAIQAQTAPSAEAQQAWQAALALTAADPFTSAGNLDGKTGGSGWAGAWTSAGSTVQAVGTTLSNPGGLLAVSGGSVKLNFSGAFDTAAATRNVAATLGADGTTTWIGFLIRPDKTSASDSLGIAFGSSTVGFVGYKGSHFVVGEAGSPTPTNVPGIAADDETAFLALKIVHGAGGDTLTLYVNPTPGLAAPDSAPSHSASTVVELGTYTGITILGSNGASNNKAQLDEIRIGESFADIAPTLGAHAPVITSNGGAASAAISRAENGSAVTTVTATDADATTPTYAISGGADAARFTIDALTGALSFVVAPDFEAPADANADNVYEVVVEASDGVLTDAQTLEVSVTNVNEAPVLDAGASPTLGSGLEGTTNPAGTTVASLVVDGSLTDADGAVEAIAITALDTTLGTWQWSADGTNWRTIDAALINNTTNELALLLGPTASLRLLPFGDLNGSLPAALTFRAWDQSTGAQGDYVAITSPGTGTSAFSAATDTASITVIAVNDAPTFAPVTGTGKLMVPVGSGDARGQSMVVQPDGRLLVAGYSVNGGTYDFSLIRLNADGTLDTTFDGDGKLIVPVGSFADRGHSMVVQPDGRILVAGYSSNGSNNDFSLIRVNADGSLDNTFDGDGKLMVQVGSGNDEGWSMVVQPDGRILAAGYSWNGSNNDFSLIRVNADGSLDTSFDGDGKLIVPVGTTDDYGWATAIQPDGRILVAGYSWNGSNNDFSLIRLNADGSLDNTFDGDGKLIVPVGGGEDVGYKLTLQPDGRVLVSGYSFNGSNKDFGLIRLNADGTLDTTFDGDGKLIVPVGSSDDFGWATAIQPDGRILVAGYSWNGSIYDFSLIRLNPDGSLDTSFDGDGKLIVPVGNSDDLGYSVALLPDGRIVMAGKSWNGTNDDFSLIRVNADGSLDTSFAGTATGTLGGTVACTENAAPVALDASVTVFDADLAALDSGAGNYSGASVTLARSGGANADDVFSARANLSFSAGNAVLSGVTVGTVTHAAGTLAITFNGNATQARVNEVLSSLAYANTSDTPPASVQIDWSFSDGNLSAQGSGGALAAPGSTTVNITAVNDTPTLSGISDQTIPEDASTTALAFTVGDAETAAASLTVSAASSNTSLVPVANIVFGGTGANRTVTVTPAANANGGPVTITLAVSDGTATTSTNFDLTVTAVNQAPPAPPAAAAVADAGIAAAPALTAAAPAAAAVPVAAASARASSAQAPTQAPTQAPAQAAEAGASVEAAFAAPGPAPALVLPVGHTSEPGDTARLVRVESTQRHADGAPAPASVLDSALPAFAAPAASPALIEPFLASMRSRGFIEDIDRLREEARGGLELDGSVAAGAAGISFGISLAYAQWLVRSGVLMGSILSTMPAWRVLDPLPVLAKPGAEGDTDDADEDGAFDAPAEARDPLRTLKDT